ncbi:MAG: insulinase family protein [Holosporales bacterium]|jgi:zinc protease|nr:insulinase family protein [Holosporales bacterium]
MNTDLMSNTQSSNTSSNVTASTSTSKPMPKKEKKKTEISSINNFQIEVHDVKTSLPNNIWFIPSKHQFISMSVIFLGAGAKNVNQTHPALSMFLGILNKGCGNFDQYQFLKKVYDNGANLNFYMGIDDAFVSFWAPINSYEEPLNFISSICLSPVCPKDQFEKMRLDIRNSFKESLKSPKTHLWEAFQNAFYPESHPYRASLQSVEKDIDLIRVNNIREYLNFLSQENAIVVVLGPREKEKEIVENIEKMLLKFPPKGKPTVSEYGEIKTPEKDISVYFDIPQTMILGRLPGFFYSDPDYYAKKLALMIVADGALDTMFFKEIREKKGLAYYCYGTDIINEGDAFLQFIIGTRNETLEEVKKIIREMILNISKNGVSKSDFNTAKNMMLGNMVVNLDSSPRIVNFFAENRATGKSIANIKEIINLCKKLTLSDINKACRQIFDPRLLRFVSIGGTVEK